MRHQESGGCLFELNMFFREGASSHYLGLSILLCGCEDFEGQSTYCKHDNWATYNKILKMYFIMFQIQLPIYFSLGRIGFVFILHKAAARKIILTNIGFKLRGIVAESICLRFKMYLSTWERSDATRREYVVPRAVNWGPRQDAGEIRWT